MNTDPHPKNASRALSHPEQSTHRDLYAAVTNHIIEALKHGVVPWRSGIRLTAGFPRNLETGRPYRGLNVFLLTSAALLRGFQSPYWLTFRQVKRRGSSVRTGERATLVLFWKNIRIRDDKTEEETNAPVLRHYHVFNLDQCQGIEIPNAGQEEAAPFEPIAACNRIVRGYGDGPTIEHGGSQPYYQPSTDKVVLPGPERFSPPEEYYATLFHELIHSTGHEYRLKRAFGSRSEQARTPAYAREELIAEMGAAFLCANAGIAPAVIQNQVAYVEGWLRLLEQDHRLLVCAAGAAQKATDWILGNRSYEERVDGRNRAGTPTNGTVTSAAPSQKGVDSQHDGGKDSPTGGER